MPSKSPIIGPPPCVSIQVDVLTDKYPEETSWTLTNTCTGDEVWTLERKDYTEKNKEYTETKCFEPSKYTFEIRDFWGDGICCDYGEGKYEVTYDGEVVFSGGEFEDSTSETFGESCGPLPTKSPSTPPTNTPSNGPTISPTSFPTSTPTNSPTTSPTTLAPTNAPTLPPTNAPTNQPTTSPTSFPTSAPTTGQPTTPPTSFPTTAPTDPPTTRPTQPAPTNAPTLSPTNIPTNQPTTGFPTSFPTKSPSNQPTSSPTTRPTTQPTDMPSKSPIIGPPPCVSIQVDVLTDKYPEETSWTLTNTCTGDEVWTLERKDYTEKNKEYTETKCFEPSKYTFEIRDFWGDGICCDYGEGKYEVTYDGEVVASGGEFDDFESETFGRSCDA